VAGKRLPIEDRGELPRLNRQVRRLYLESVAMALLFTALAIAVPARAG